MDGDDASLRARSRRGVRATVAKRRRMDAVPPCIDPSSLGVDVASPSSSARGGGARARRADAPRARSRRRSGCRFRSITEREMASTTSGGGADDGVPARARRGQDARG